MLFGPTQFDVAQAYIPASMSSLCTLTYGLRMEICLVRFSSNLGFLVGFF